MPDTLIQNCQNEMKRKVKWLQNNQYCKCQLCHFEVAKKTKQNVTIEITTIQLLWLFEV